MEITRLAGCVISDENHQILLLHRTDHDQWQLPGGRMRLITDGVWEDPCDTVIRESYGEIGLEISQEHIRWLGHTVFQQGIMAYSCEWHEVMEYEGEPTLHQPKVYNDMGFFNLYKRGIGRIGLSPNVEQLSARLQSGSIHLWRK